MQMKVHVGGMGFGLGGTKVGVSFGKFAHILLRNSPDEGFRSLHIYDHFSLGSAGQVSGISTLNTEWFPLNVSRYPWLRKHQQLIGRKAILRVEGISLFTGALKVGVDIRVLDRFHNVAHQFSVYQIPVLRTSIQVGSIAIEGEIERNDLRTQRLMEQVDRQNSEEQVSE